MRNAELERKYYQEHKERIRAQNKIRYQTPKYKEYAAKSGHKFRIKRQTFLNRLKNKPCMDCQGWFEPCQMDFDHRDASTKIDNVGSLLCSRNTKALLDEIRKCDLVCANCHRLRTAKQFKAQVFKGVRSKYVY